MDSRRRGKQARGSAGRPEVLVPACTLTTGAAALHLPLPPAFRYMLASLREAAIAAGHPEWGHGGPHDSGNYNSQSFETGFFKSYGGSWDSGALGAGGKQAWQCLAACTLYFATLQLCWAVELHAASSRRPSSYPPHQPGC